MKLIKVTTTNEWRDGTKSGCNTGEAIYMVTGVFKKRMYYISQNIAMPVINMGIPPEPKDIDPEEQQEQADSMRDDMRESGEGRA